MRGIIVISALLIVTGCSRGGGQYESASSEPAPEVVKPMLVTPSPHYIIYSPPVDLAKKKA